MLLMDDIFQAIEDRLEASELVDFIGLTTRDILHEFREEVIENIEEIKELLNLKEDNEEENYE